MNQKYAFGVKVMFLFLCLNFQLTGQDRSHDFEKELNIRPISEINSIGIGDAYPWISDDGLRLYYTSKNSEQEKSCIWSASRNDVYSNFQDFNKLSINDHSVDNLSSWFSQDELTVAFVRRERTGQQMTSIFIAQRNFPDEPFEEPQKIKIEGSIKGTLLSPSLTPDKSELILFNEYKTQKFLLVFQKVNQSTYKFKYEIKIPKSYSIKAGKLNHNGLSYFVSFEHHRNNPKVYMLTRNTINDQFDKLIPLNNNSLNTENDRTHQPHFSSNGNFVVFTRSVENAWMHNEVFIGQVNSIGENIAKIYSEPNEEDELIELAIYPNPSASFVSISNPGNRILEAHIFNTQGQLIQIINNEKLSHRIDISFLTAGPYIFRVKDLNNSGERVFRVIKVE